MSKYAYFKKLCSDLFLQAAIVETVVENCRL